MSPSIASASSRARNTATPLAPRATKMTATLFFAIGLVLLFAQIGGRAQVVDPLSYGGGMLLTGDFVASGVDLHEDVNPPDAQGMSTGTINMSGVPADADIVAAYLSWETITFTAAPNHTTPRIP